MILVLLLISLWIAHTCSYVIQTLVHDPPIYVIPDYLDLAQVQALKTLVQPHLVPSRVYSNHSSTTTTGSTSSRSSLSVSLPRHSGHAMLDELHRRLETLVGQRPEVGEELQIQMYPPEGHYVLHMDASEDVRRAITILIYLSDGTNVSGGQTIFPYLNTSQLDNTPPPLSQSESYLKDVCAMANMVKIQPQRGTAVIFYPLTLSGALDYRTFHGSCPVVGTTAKWIAQKWFRTEDYFGIGGST